MSNVKTIQQIYEAFGRGDIAAIRERFADNARWEHHPAGNSAQEHDVPYMRRRSGRDAATEFFKDIAEDFELHSFNPHSFLEGKALVAVVVEYELTVKATGKRIRDEEIHLWEFGAGGKITGYRHFLDTAKAIDAHS